VKYKGVLLLVILAIFASSSKAQQTSCTSVVYQMSAHTATYTKAYYNTYVSQESYTYTVTCVNTNISQTISVQRATANATGGWYLINGLKYGCSPTWWEQAGTPDPPKLAWFSVAGQSYLQDNTNSGECTPGDQQVTTVYCTTIACVSQNNCEPTGVPPGDGFGNWYWDTSCCCWSENDTPIIIDTTGKGFSLTDAVDGVTFDIKANGHPIQIGWTARGSTNAFLALPEADGLVHNGKDLFGNYTPQPPSRNPNGFLALAVYDEPENGGNGDGIIDSRDGIFSSLRLWIDANHDGICQPEELHTLPSLGVNSISLHYSLSWRTDQYGNKFRYKAAVNPDDPTESKVGRTAYDVIFVVAEPLAKVQSCPLTRGLLKHAASATNSK